MRIRKKELKQIWDWLEAQIAPEDREWLKKHGPGVWIEFSKDGFPIKDESRTLWEAYNADTVFELSFRIQNVLDAKAKREKANYQCCDGLPVQYVIELAELLGLKISKEKPKYAIVSEVLKGIQEKEKENKK